MSRDIEKDKETILRSENPNELYCISSYWINQYEASQARIRELEEKLQLHNRPDVKSRKRHTEALINHFEEMRKYHARS